MGRGQVDLAFGSLDAVDGDCAGLEQLSGLQVDSVLRLAVLVGEVQVKDIRVAQRECVGCQRRELVGKDCEGAAAACGDFARHKLTANPRCRDLAVERA